MIYSTSLGLEERSSQNRPTTTSLPTQDQPAGAAMDEQHEASQQNRDNTTLSIFGDVWSACRECCAWVTGEARPGETVATKGAILRRKKVDQFGNNCAGAKVNRKTRRANYSLITKPTWTSIKCPYINSFSFDLHLSPKRPVQRFDYTDSSYYWNYS